MNRRTFVKSAAASAAAVLTSRTLLAQDKPERKVLFVYGGWKGHEPEKTRDIFVPFMRNQGWSVTVSDTLDSYLDEDLMAELDLIVPIWTMGEIKKEQEKALLEAVKRGVGLAGWHGGLCDAFRQNVAYQFMTGGQWVAHPGGVIDYSVDIVDQEDEITKGLGRFDMHSEQYYMHVDPNVKVLATTTFNGEHAPWIDGAVMPITWKKFWGEGRVFYTSLGHVAADFDVPEALTMMQRGILWAAESKYAPKETWLQPVYKNHGQG